MSIINDVIKMEYYDYDSRRDTCPPIAKKFLVLF